MTKDNKFQIEALTFDDVLLVPSYSEVLPSETSVKTSLSKNIKLNIPIIALTRTKVAHIWCRGSYNTIPCIKTNKVVIFKYIKVRQLYGYVRGNIRDHS